jgi:hypothetical protein
MNDSLAAGASPPPDESGLGTQEALAQGMAINGVITSRHVLRYTVTIVREFGPRAYLRCCAAMLAGRRTTFLACVFAR